MNTGAKNPLALRVLNGSARGAEVELRRGIRYTLGVDDDADLIIDDAGIGGRHAEVEVEGNVVRVSPVLPAQVILEGQAFEGGVVPLYTAVVLGRTAVAFGEYGESWPRVEIPADAGIPAERMAEVASEVAGEVPPEPKNRLARRSWLWPMLGTVAVLMVLIPSGLGVFEMIKLHRLAQQDLAAEEDPVVETGRLLEHVLRPTDPGRRPVGWADDWSLLELRRQGNAWMIKGYLADRVAVDHLKTAVAAEFESSSLQQSPIIWRVSQVALLQANLQEVLARLGLEAKVAYLNNGYFAVEGERPASANWDQKWRQLAMTVQREVPAIQKLFDRTKGTATIADGSAPSPGIPAGDVDSDSRIRLPIRSISLGRSSCVTLVSGERLFEGAELPSGHRLESIEPGRLIVSQGGRRLQLVINPELLKESKSNDP